MYILSQLKDICKMGSNLTRVLLDTLCISIKQQLPEVDGLHQAKPVRTPYPLPPPLPPPPHPNQCLDNNPFDISYQLDIFWIMLVVKLMRLTKRKGKQLSPVIH